MQPNWTGAWRLETEMIGRAMEECSLRLGKNTPLSHLESCDLRCSGLGSAQKLRSKRNGLPIGAEQGRGALTTARRPFKLLWGQFWHDCVPGTTSGEAPGVGRGGGAEGYTTAGNLSLYRLTLGVPFDVILTHGHGTEDRPPRRPRKVPSEFDTNGK